MREIQRMRRCVCGCNFPMESVLERDIKKCLNINCIGLNHKFNKNLMNSFSALCVINIRHTIRERERERIDTLRRLTVITMCRDLEPV